MSVAQLAGGNGNGQCQARQFAARGDLGNRVQAAACMACYQKVHRINAMRTGLGVGLHICQKTPALHAQLLNAGCNGFRQASCRRDALLRDGLRRLQVGLVRLFLLLLQGREVGLLLQRLQLALPLLPQFG